MVSFINSDVDGYIGHIMDWPLTTAVSVNEWSHTSITTLVISYMIVHVMTDTTERKPTHQSIGNYGNAVCLLPIATLYYDLIALYS